MIATQTPPRTLVVCPHCDAVHRMVTVRQGARVGCHRCGCTLCSETRLPLQALLASTIAALMFFAIANLTPLLTFELAGERRPAPLWAGVRAFLYVQTPVDNRLTGRSSGLRAARDAAGSKPQPEARAS